METTTPVRPMRPQFAPYDPADSPGPIPSIVDRFRPRRHEPGDEGPAEDATLRRYTVVLVTPEQAEALGFDRSDGGFKLYLDDDWDGDLADLDHAVRCLEDECGIPVTLVEHHADLTYWTARPRH